MKDCIINIFPITLLVIVFVYFYTIGTPILRHENIYAITIYFVMITSIGGALLFFIVDSLQKIYHHWKTGEE